MNTHIYKPFKFFGLIIIMPLLIICSNSAAWENQIDSMDNWAATGWRDLTEPNDPNLMEQGNESAEIYEGTGSMVIRCDLMRDANYWDVHAAKEFSPTLDLTASGNGVGQTALRVWVYTDPNIPLTEQVYAINVSSSNGGYATYEAGVPALNGWRELVAPIEDFVDDSNEFEPNIDFNDIREIDIHVTSYPEAGAPLYIDDLRLSDDVNTPSYLGQLESFDDWAATGWYEGSEPNHLDLMEQETGSKVYEGTGSLRVKCENMYGGDPCLWDIYAIKEFGAGLDLTASGNGVQQTALRLWFYTDPNIPISEQLYAVNVFSSNGGFASYETGGPPAIHGWREIVAPISDFVDEANESEPNVVFSEITKIELHVSGYSETLLAGDSVYIDDLRLSSDANQPVFLGQIESFDSWYKSGWFDELSSGLMVQAGEAQSHEGTGALRIKCEEMQNGFPGWDVHAMKDFGAGIDMTAAGNRVDETALRFWLYSDNAGAERIYAINLSSKNDGWAVYEVGYTLKTGWQEIIVPINGFVNDPYDEVEQDIDFTKIFNIDIHVTSWEVPGNSIYIDDLRLSSDARIPFEGQMMYADYGTMTIDANASDWQNLNSSIKSMNLQSLPTPEDNGDLYCEYSLAWDEDYLYLLIEEKTGDTLATEAPDRDSLEDRGGVAYDGMSFFFDFDSDGSRNNTGSEANLDYWLWAGLSSTDQNDLLMVWTQGDWGSNDPAATANSTVATSGSLGSRVVEARISWDDVNNVLTEERQPQGGLLNAIGAGYVSGCDPRVIDTENTDDPYDTSRGSAWMHGNMWGAPSGNDAYSTDVMLICKSPVDMDGNCKTNFVDMAYLAGEWLNEDCGISNSWCGKTDVEPTGHPDGDVDYGDLAELASHWLMGAD